MESHLDQGVSGVLSGVLDGNFMAVRKALAFWAGAGEFGPTGASAHSGSGGVCLSRKDCKVCHVTVSESQTTY